jgi:Flp pilus assembly protein TadG
MSGAISTIMKMRPLSHRTGSALTEFALTLPLLVFLLFGIIQYGFIFSAYVTLRHGAHFTARTLSLAASDNTTSNTMQVAKSSITPMLDPNRLQSAVLTSNTVAGLRAVNAQLVYNLPLILPIVVPGATDGTKVLTASATYRAN